MRKHCICKQVAIASCPKEEMASEDIWLALTKWLGHPRLRSAPLNHHFVAADAGFVMIGSAFYRTIRERNLREEFAVRNSPAILSKIRQTRSPKMRSWTQIRYCSNLE